MRVRLSYTVEEEDVLAEGAKIINLSADDMQQAISLFNEVQKELKGHDDETVINIPKCFEMIEEMRKALVNVDTRLEEVTEIVKGFDDYQRHVKAQVEAPPIAPEEVPAVASEEPVDED
jgi:hypothetical protein|tara:strand:+ start:510 stop:866 length:357 start_codon:yes stop_codon:yes gene_type:complete